MFTVLVTMVVALIATVKAEVRIIANLTDVEL